MSDEICKLGWASGRVQGVGFRYHVMNAARVHGVAGYAHNLPDGRVEVLLQGSERAVQLAMMEVEAGPLHSEVRGVQWQDSILDEDLSGFTTG